MLGTCCNDCCSMYEANFTQQQPYKIEFKLFIYIKFLNSLFLSPDLNISKFSLFLCSTSDRSFYMTEVVLQLVLFPQHIKFILSLFNIILF